MSASAPDTQVSAPDTQAPAPDTQARAPDAMPDDTSPTTATSSPTGQPSPLERVALTDAQRRSRRNRSLALGVVLAALVALFYVATLAKLGGDLTGVDAMRDL